MVHNSIDKIEIHSAGDNGFYFTFKSHQQTIFVSRFFANKADTQKAVETIKLNAASKKNYTRKKSPIGETYFIFRISGEDPVGQSMMHKCASSMISCIETMRSLPTDITIEDLSA